MSRYWLGLLLFAVWIGGDRVANATLTAPAQVDIGNVVVGQSNTADATLSADVTTGNVSVTLASGGDCGLFVITAPTFPITVGPGAANNKSVTFKFSPNATGDRGCLATVKQASTTLATFLVKGHGTAPQITVLAPSPVLQLQFNHVDFGQTSNPLQVVIHNDGDAPLTATAAFTAGAVDYLVSGGPGGPLAANGGQATWNITCKPSASGGRDGNFQITSDSFNNKTVDIALNCVGDQGVLASNFAMLDFGRVFRGTTATKTFTLSNPGNVVVDNVVGVLAPTTAGYSIDPLTPIPGALNANEPKQVRVTFSPLNTSHGGLATLTLSGSWGSGPTIPTSVPIAVTGLEASFSLPDAPATLEFGMFRFDAHLPKTFQIVNDGNAALLIQVPFTPDLGTAEHDYQLEFIKGSMVVTTPQVPLAAGERVDVIVAPQVVNRIGSVGGVLEVTSDAGGSQKLTVTGIATSANVKIPSALDFGVVDVNAPPQIKNVTIENTGNGMLDVQSIVATSATPGEAPNPAFTIAAPSAPTQLAPNATLDIPIMYRPTIAGISDTVILTAHLAGSLSADATVTITGNAVFTDVYGGGGCNARRADRGAGLAIGLLALGCVRRRRRGTLARRATARARVSVAQVSVASVAIASLLAIAPARADDIGIAVFQPAPAITGEGFALQAPDVGADGSWVTSAVVSYASNPLLTAAVTSEGRATSALVEHSTLMQLGAAYALFDRFELGARFPLYQQSGDAGPTGQSAHGVSRGNLALHGKARLWRGSLAPGRFSVGASAIGVVPTASKGQFTGSDQPEARLLVLGSFIPSALDARLTLSVNAGPVIRGKSQYANLVEQSGVAWGVGASYRILDALWATAELFGESTPSGRRPPPMATAMPAPVTLSPIEWLAGVILKPERRISVGLAFGRGATNAAGAPDLRGVLALAFVPGAAVAAPVHARVAAVDPPAPTTPPSPTGAPATTSQRSPDSEATTAGSTSPTDPPTNPPAPTNQPAPTHQPAPADPAAAIKAPSPVNQPLPPAQPSTATRTAEDTFASGRELMKQGKYAAACAAFEQSQRLDPQFGTQYNLAGCYDKLGKIATAWNLYREIVRRDSNSVRKAKAGELAEALAGRVPRLKLVLSQKPDGVQVVLNGADASALIGAETPVDFGRYTVTATAAGYRAWQKTVAVTEDGAVVVVVIELQSAR